MTTGYSSFEHSRERRIRALYPRVPGTPTHRARVAAIWAIQFPKKVVREIDLEIAYLVLALVALVLQPPPEIRTPEIRTPHLDLAQKFGLGVKTKTVTKYTWADPFLNKTH